MSEWKQAALRPHSQFKKKNEYIKLLQTVLFLKKHPVIFLEKTTTTIQADKNTWGGGEQEGDREGGKESEEMTFYPPCWGRERVLMFYGEIDSLLIEEEKQEQEEEEDKVEQKEGEWQ